MDEIPAWAMEKAEDLFRHILGSLSSRNPIYSELEASLALALVAERERAATIAQTYIPEGKGKARSVAHAAGHYISAAIRYGE